MFEKAQLQNKLENLENVFIGSAIKRNGGGTNSAKTGESGQEGLSQDYATQNLLIENNDLKKRVFILEQEKIEIQKNLSAAFMGRSG